MAIDLPINNKSSRKLASDKRASAVASANKAPRFSFAFRLSLVMSALCLLSAALLSGFVIVQYQKHAAQQELELSRAIASQLAIGMVDPVFTDDTLAMQLHLNQLIQNKSITSAAVVNRDSQILVNATRSERRLREMRIWLSQQGQLSADERNHNASESRFLVKDVSLNGVTAAFVVISLQSSNEVFSFAQASRNLIFVVIGIVLLASACAYFISRLLARPVYRLLEVSEAARSGRIDEIDSLIGGKTLDNEWGDILDIYSELGQEVRSNQELESMLERFVATDVANHLLSGNQRLMLEGSRVEATVLFVDIVDFTRTAEQISPEDVAALLNRYLEIFAACARIHRGTVDKFIGDEAMIVFGTPRSDENHRENAMACAQAIQQTATLINSKRTKLGLKPIFLRAGINTGQMYAGILGSEHRMEFTVVGDSVNLAARLCEAALPGETLLAHDVYKDVMMPAIQVESAGELRVKGKQDEILTSRLIKARTDKHWVVRSLIDDLVAMNDRNESPY